MDDKCKRTEKTNEDFYLCSVNVATENRSSHLGCIFCEQLSTAAVTHDCQDSFAITNKRCCRTKSSSSEPCTFAARKRQLNQDSSLADTFTSLTDYNEMNCRLKKTRQLKHSQKNLVLSILLLLFCHFQSPVIAVRSAAFPPSTSRQRVRYRPDLYRRSDRTRCETIQIPTCVDVGYNVTDMALSPSNIYKQSDALQAVKQFNMLLRFGCAEEMKLLVCSIYTPICMPTYPKFLPPCRFICERARKGCEPFFKHYNQPWPELFNCDKYPAYTGENPLCLHFNRSVTGQPKYTTLSYPRSLQNKSSLAPQQRRPTEMPPLNTTGTETQLTRNDDCQCRCSTPMIPITDRSDPLYNQVRTGLVHNCAMPCRSPYFSAEKQLFAEMWIKVWSVVCFFITLVTVGTFLIDTDRFKYPERPIIFLSACYMFVSVGFLIRVVAGHEAVACSIRSDQILYKTTGPFLCSVVYLLIYFFGMAAAIWWVFLSLTWFLAAGLKWGSEAIAYYSPYFHGVAWMFPALKSIAILATSSVDGDPLSGICYVGNHDTTTLIAFVIVPLVLYLGLGIFFLVLGYVYLCRIRISIKKVGKRTDTLEKLMKRIGLFSILYMIPSIVLLACHCYELQNRQKWANAFNCRRPNGLPCINGAKSRPEFEVFIVKYSVALLIGVTNGVWICSGKTITSWKRFYRRCYCCIYDLTSIITWFKRRNMKANLSSGSSETNVDTTPQTNSKRSSIQSGELENHFFLSNQRGSTRLSSGDQEFSSRDDTAVCCNHVTVLGQVSPCKNKRHKPESLRHRTSDARPGINCLRPECSYISFESTNQPCTSCVTSINGDVSRKVFDAIISNERSEGTIVVPMCRQNGTHCLPRPICVTEGGLPLACQASKSPVSRSISHRLSNNSNVQAELDPGRRIMYCDQSGSVAVLESRSPILVESECGSNKVQHIHHHHHHVVSELTCLCHNRPHANSRRNSSQKPRHSSNDSWSSKVYLQNDAQRKMRASPPVGRTSPTGYNSLHR